MEIGEALVAQSLIAAGGLAVSADGPRVQMALAAVARASQPINALSYEAIRDAILSGQLPDSQVPKIVSYMPEDFQVWWGRQSCATTPCP